MSSAKKREKKKTPTWFLGIVIVAMLAVFVVQMLFPTNLGKIYAEKTQDAVEITVTVTASEEGIHSYHTDDLEDISNFGAWADSKTMRNRSLADSLNAESKKLTKYNFAIKSSDDTLDAIVIDEKGFVHAGVELYKVTDDEDEFIKELIEQLETWGKE